MKKSLFILLLIVQVSALKAQFAAVYTKDSFTRLENDSAVLTPAEGLRGSFQWQRSSDSVNWTDVETNLAEDRLAFIPEQTEVYRLQISEGTCLPLYSDTAIVFSRHTTLTEYLEAGIPVYDLNAAGVSVTDLMATGFSLPDLFNVGIMVGTMEREGIDSLALAEAELIGTLSDIDGNQYKWIKINDQVWMAENLRVTHSPDGNAIPMVLETEEWKNLGDADEAYCYFSGSLTLEATYGKLYTWSASTQVCPTGWHLPDDAEWIGLISYLGGRSVAGGKMKESGTTHWEYPNSGATNESGFNALPGGYHNFGGGGYGRLYVHSHFWSSVEISAARASYVQLYFGNAALVHSDQYKKNGFSVRCIRD